MQITNDKFKKALLEIDKVLYGKIKHLNNQARLLHVAEILSKVVVDGKIKEENEEDDEDVNEVKSISSKEEEVSLEKLYKKFYDLYMQGEYYYSKAGEVSETIEEIKKQ